jgi:hypothetical protein
VIEEQGQRRLLNLSRRDSRRQLRKVELNQPHASGTTYGNRGCGAKIGSVAGHVVGVLRRLERLGETRDRRNRQCRGREIEQALHFFLSFSGLSSAPAPQRDDCAEGQQ